MRQYLGSAEARGAGEALVQSQEGRTRQRVRGFSSTALGIITPTTEKVQMENGGETPFQSYGQGRLTHPHYTRGSRDSPDAIHARQNISGPTATCTAKEQACSYSDGAIRLWMDIPENDL